MGKTGRPDESRGMGCTSFRDPSASFLFLDIFFGTKSTICDLSSTHHMNLLCLHKYTRVVIRVFTTSTRTKKNKSYSRDSSLHEYLHSSFPFSFPRSFLSFLGFLSSPSSPADTDDMRLWAGGRPEAPVGTEVRVTGGTGGRELELGVGSISPSDRDWY